MKITIPPEEITAWLKRLKLNRLNIVEAITPTNIFSAKEYFIEQAIQSKFPNIQLQYDRHKLSKCCVEDSTISIAKQHILDNIIPESPADNTVYEILHNRLNQLHFANNLIHSILSKSTQSTKDAVHALYGIVEQNEFTEAVRAPRTHDHSQLTDEDLIKKLKNQKFNALDIAFFFQQALNYCGIKNWRVDIGSQYSSIDARDLNFDGEPTLGIPQDRVVDGLKLASLVGHEINCHIRNVENSRAWFDDNLDADNPLRPLIPFLSKSFSEKEYEGVAKIADHYTTGKSPTPDYIVTISFAQNVNSWSQVAKHCYYNALAKGKTPEQAAQRAWIFTYRTLRGVSDTANTEGYAFTKDAGYLLGYKRMQKLAELNPLYLDFASVTESDARAFIGASSELAPRYPDRKAATWIAENLLSRF